MDLSSLPPDQLAELLGLSTADEKQALLEQQLQQALALRNHARPQHDSPGGAAFGALSQMLDSASSIGQEQKLRAQMEEAAIDRCHAILARWQQTEERHYTIAPLRWATSLLAESGDATGARAQKGAGRDRPEGAGAGRKIPRRKGRDHQARIVSRSIETAGIV